MMAQSRAESTREINDYGKYINQFPLNTIKSIRLYERISKKICRQKIFIMFNEICIYIYIYIYIYTNFIEHNRHFLSTYFLLDPFVLPYCFYRIQQELIYVLSIVVYIPSTFCPTLGHHQERIYYKSDVTFVFVICLSTRSRLYSKVLLYLWAAGSWSLKYVYFDSISSLIQISLNIIDPPLMMAQNRAESTRDIYNYRQYINQFPPNTIKAIRQYERIQKKYADRKCLLCLTKFLLMKKCCQNMHIYIYIYIYMLPHGGWALWRRNCRPPLA